MKRIHIVIMFIIFACFICAFFWFNTLSADDIAPIVNYKRPKEITVAIRKDSSGFMQSMKREFESRQDSIRIKLIEISPDSDGSYRTLISALSSGMQMFDAAEVEDVWIPEFVENGYIKNLDGKIDISQDILSEAADGMKYGGSLYAAPFELDIDILFYNKTMDYDSLSYFEKFENINTMAAKTVDSAFSDNDMICLISEIGKYYNGDINKAIDIYCKMISADDDAVASFRLGRSPMVWTAASNKLAMGGSKSKVAGIFSTVNISDKNGRLISVLRRYGLAVNERSKLSDEATEFIRFCTQSENQKLLCRQRNTVPVRKSFYSDPTVLDSVSYAAGIKDRISEFTVRPSCPDYAERVQKIRESVRRYAAGDTAGKADAEREFMQIFAVETD